jgi:cytochrome c biogenesis factor
MILGNIILVRTLINGDYNSQYVKDFAMSCYRMIQLGCFLITVGIILGGVWADYSWGRFWGWDPKETWALIADLGFLAVLHAKFVGWLSPFGILASSTVAFLLVLMAWYGVNFILAAGLHSYGFSSGGATIVGTFVSIQLIILIVSLVIKSQRAKKMPTVN